MFTPLIAPVKLELENVEAPSERNTNPPAAVYGLDDDPVFKMVPEKTHDVIVSPNSTYPTNPPTKLVVVDKEIAMETVQLVIVMAIVVTYTNPANPIRVLAVALPEMATFVKLARFLKTE